MARIAYILRPRLLSARVPSTRRPRPSPPTTRPPIPAPRAPSTRPATASTNPSPPPTPRKPGDLPGLRIIRLREAADRAIVAHLFGVPYDEQAQQRTPGNGRFSGLVQHSDTVFYATQPPPSGDRPRAFLQDGDDPAELAMYVQALRRSVLHAINDTV